VTVEDGDMAVMALAENIDREDLLTMRICLALRKIENLVSTRKKLAEAIGLNREDMYRYFAFEALPDDILSKLSINHACCRVRRDSCQAGHADN